MSDGGGELEIEILINFNNKNSSASASSIVNLSWLSFLNLIYFLMRRGFNLSSGCTFTGTIIII